MADNAQKTPFVQSLPAAVKAAILDAIQQLGKSLPCRVVSVSGQIVTVAFEAEAAPFTLPNVTIPIATSLYDWLPVQAGDTGVAQAADAYLGGISGLGGGTADLTQRGNLTALVFQPVSKRAWSVPLATQRVVQGPAGVLMQVIGGSNFINIGIADLTIVAAGQTIEMNSGGIILNGVTWGTHGHHQPADSHGDTEALTTGPVNP